MNSFVTSILIPTHNRAEILRRTLSSLAAVTVPSGVDAEVVVVANGCTDRTEAVVDEIAAQMPFPTRCIPEPQLGLNVARNRAIREARHESQVLVFLDDDVALDQQWLVALKEAFETTPADVVAGKLTLWWEAVTRPEWMTPEMEARSASLISAIKWWNQVMNLRLSEPTSLSDEKWSRRLACFCRDWIVWEVRYCRAARRSSCAALGSKVFESSMPPRCMPSTG